MSNWSSITPYNIGQPGSTTVGGTGGGGGLPPGIRNHLDAARAAMGRVPSADYPDGYLGTITDRREDRLLKNLKNRLTDRSYQRGVHVGSKVDPRSYFWTPEFNPDTGLEYEAAGRKWTAKGSPTERLAHGGKTTYLNPTELGELYDKVGLPHDAAMRKATPDPVRTAQLQGFRPKWR